jgi:hypothetical protein
MVVVLAFLITNEPDGLLCSTSATWGQIVAEIVATGHLWTHLHTVGVIVGQEAVVSHEAYRDTLALLSRRGERERRGVLRGNLGPRTRRRRRRGLLLRGALRLRPNLSPLCLCLVVSRGMILG